MPNRLEDIDRSISIRTEVTENYARGWRIVLQLIHSAHLSEEDAKCVWFALADDDITALSRAWSEL